MTGIAQKLFAERTLKKLVIEGEEQFHWSLLQKMFEAKCLRYVDLALAQWLLGTNGQESAAALICHLSIASRRGHICVKIENGSIIPSVEEIWISEDQELAKMVSLNDKKYLSQLVVQGTENLSLIKEIVEKSSLKTPKQNCFQSPIIKNQSTYYLQRYWCLESSFLTGLKQLLLEDRKLFPIDQQIVEIQVNVLLMQKKLLKEQAVALLSACKSPFTIITGGPGTGKTYTAGLLIQIILNAIDVENRLDFKIALAAPTGKAAANLEMSINNALKGLEGFSCEQAKTLHQLLGVKKNRADYQSNILSADLILVDESSMIDISLMDQLFAALKPGARLVLLGDRYQLPSVEAGSLFADLTTYFLSNQDKHTHVVELKTCLRAELRSILDLATQIKFGNQSEVLQLLQKNIEGISLVEFDEVLSIQEKQKQLLNYAIPHFPIVNDLSDNPMELLELFARFRILTPMRKGPFGVDTLNALFFKVLNSKISPKGCSIAPIMVMQNNYRRDLFNGEIGLLVKDREESEYVLFFSRESDQNFRKIPLLLMPRFEYAYCLSVHKSQGSEFDHVVLLLPEGSQSFGKEALYTGVTRAKRRLEIWSTPQIVDQMMKLATIRQSGVVERLSNFN